MIIADNLLKSYSWKHNIDDIKKRMILIFENYLSLKIKCSMKKKRKERYFIYHENRIDSQEIYYLQLQCFG